MSKTKTLIIITSVLLVLIVSTKVMTLDGDNLDNVQIDKDIVIEHVFPSLDAIPSNILSISPNYLPYKVENITPHPVRNADGKVVGKSINTGNFANIESVEEIDINKHQRIFYQVIDLTYSKEIPELWEHRVLSRIEDIEKEIFKNNDITYTVIIGKNEARILDKTHINKHIAVSWENNGLRYSLYTINVPFEEVKKVVESFN